MNSFSSAFRLYLIAALIVVAPTTLYLYEASKGRHYQETISVLQLQIDNLESRLEHSLGLGTRY